MTTGWRNQGPAEGLWVQRLKALWRPTQGGIATSGLVQPVNVVQSNTGLWSNEGAPAGIVQGSTGAPAAGEHAAIAFVPLRDQMDLRILDLQLGFFTTSIHIARVSGTEAFFSGATAITPSSGTTTFPGLISRDAAFQELVACSRLSIAAGSLPARVSFPPTSTGFVNISGSPFAWQTRQNEPLRGILIVAGTADDDFTSWVRLQGVQNVALV